MIHRLSTRITLQYLGLFSAAIIVMGVIIYFAVLSHAQHHVRHDMDSAARVYQQLLSLKSGPQAQGATRLSEDAGFREDLIARDKAGLTQKLNDAKRFLSADVDAVIALDGQVLVSDNPHFAAALGPTIADKGDQTARSGIMRVDGQAYKAVLIPIRTEKGTGWIAFASRLDAPVFNASKTLSAIPVATSVMTRSDNGHWWGHAKHHKHFNAHELNPFIDGYLTHQKTGVLEANGKLMITAATALPGLDGKSDHVLLLSYPLDEALGAYHPLLTLLLGIGCLVLGLIVLSSLYMAKSLTKPIRILTEAASQLGSGRIQLVKINSGDEMEDLARAFNTMALAIEDRESRILHLARHDLAANLPNRTALEEHMEALIAKSGEQGLLAFAIGIERFSHLRAVWGADTANGLFEVLARTLLLEYPNARLARLNTDTLGFVLMQDSHNAAHTIAPVIAKAISARLDARFRVQDRSLDITVSVGFAVSGQRALRATERLERALIALDQARAAKLKVLAFSTGIYDALSDNLLLTEQLHTALERNELSVHYQPKYNYRTQSLSAAEALVRWNHAERGWVAPMKFVLIAEETGYIRDLTLQVIVRVLEDQARLKAAGFDITMSINYSGRLLNDETFIETTLELLCEAGGPICLEITETAVIEDPKLGIQAINRFKAAGIDISIDDFGTGLSSLAYLKLIPAQELKIDRSFIKDIETSTKDALVVRSTIDLGHGLGMKITAEGVESEETLAMLAGMGCDMAQGYGIAYPMPIDDLMTFLKAKAETGLAPLPAPAKARPLRIAARRSHKT